MTAHHRCRAACRARPMSAARLWPIRALAVLITAMVVASCGGDVGATPSANTTPARPAAAPSATAAPIPPSGLPPHVSWGICGVPDQCSGDLIDAEAALGRTFAVAKTYHPFSAKALTDADRTLAFSDHALLYSISPLEQSASGALTFDRLTDVVAGRYDDQLIAQLQALNRIPTTPFVIFDDEPDNATEAKACSKPGDHKVCGPEFAAAWRHVHDFAKARGLTRLRWVMALSATLYAEAPDAVDLYYPGAGYVDWIGANLYNRDCGTRTAAYKTDTFAKLFAPVLAWHDARAKDLPIVLPEWGAPELPGDPGARADWLRAAAATMQTVPALRMVSYWDGSGDVVSGCDYSLKPGQPALDVFKQIG